MELPSFTLLTWMLLLLAGLTVARGGLGSALLRGGPHFLARGKVLRFFLGGALPGGYAPQKTMWTTVVQECLRAMQALLLTRSAPPRWPLRPRILRRLRALDNVHYALTLTEPRCTPALLGGLMDQYGLSIQALCRVLPRTKDRNRMRRYMNRLCRTALAALDPVVPASTSLENPDDHATTDVANAVHAGGGGDTISTTHATA